MANVASLTYSQVKFRKNSPGLIYQVMTELDQLEEKYLNGVFSVHEVTGTEWTLTLAQWQRRSFMFAIRLVDLNLCRAALGPSLLPEAMRTDAHKRALKCALQIAEMSQANCCKLFNMSWYGCTFFCMKWNTLN